MRLLGQKHSINVRKVLWTCAELGLTPLCEDWGGNTRKTTTPEFLKLNPKGLVPVLVDRGLVLSESNTNCRYLAAREKRTDLLPKQPDLRAVVESWMDWQATELNSAWRAVFMGRVREHPDFQSSENRRKAFMHGTPRCRCWVCTWINQVVLCAETISRWPTWFWVCLPTVGSSRRCNALCYPP